MATERIVDLANQRYADRPYEGELPESTALAEGLRAERRAVALARLRERAHWDTGALALDKLDLQNLLTLLGLDE
jgi:hypothetical protein